MNTQDKIRAFMQEKIQTQKTEGAAFLAQNKTQPGVVEIPEGIQYLILQEGSGRNPAPTDSVKAHYAGSLLSGKEFDSSFRRNQPFTAPLKALIKGWQIALPMMSEGSRWRLWIPSDLAYGDRGAGSDIPGGATLVFEVELLEVIS
jgi:FKBP-type peptidyl-prolyl cis-trans isomerase FklB